MRPDHAWDEATEKLIAGCAKHVCKHLNPALTRQDILQEGRAALLEALHDGKVPVDPDHRRHYIVRRVLGAMQNANRAARAQQPDDVREISELTPDAGSVQQPDRICEMRQAIAWLYDHASKEVVESIELLAEGHDPVRVGWMVGVSASRVSQRRRQARELIAHCW